MRCVCVCLCSLAQERSVFSVRFTAGSILLCHNTDELSFHGGKWGASFVLWSILLLRLGQKSKETENRTNWLKFPLQKCQINVRKYHAFEIVFLHWITKSFCIILNCVWGASIVGQGRKFPNFKNQIQRHAVMEKRIKKGRLVLMTVWSYHEFDIYL